MLAYSLKGLALWAVFNPSHLAPVPLSHCKHHINVSEGYIRIDMNTKNTSCLFTFLEQNLNRSAHGHDQVGAMHFSASVIAVYGLSIALLIGLTLKRNETDNEVKGFLRSFAKIDIYRKQSEMNKMKQTLFRIHAGLHRAPERSARSRRGSTGSINKARIRQRRRSHDRMLFNINAVHLVERNSSKEIAAVVSTSIPASGQRRIQPMIHRSSLPYVDEIDEDRVSSTSAVEDTDSATSFVWWAKRVGDVRTLWLA